MSIKTREISKYLYPPLAKLHPLLLQLTAIKGPEDLDSLKDAEDAIKGPEFAIKAAVEHYKAKKAKAAAENHYRYDEKVIDHSENPWNFDSFDENDPSVDTGVAFAYHDHCRAKFQIKVAAGEIGGEIISTVKYKAFGCEVAIASSSVASEMICGKKLNEVITFVNWEIIFATSEIIRFLSVPPIKYQCVLEPIAIRATILDYMSKK